MRALWRVPAKESLGVRAAVGTGAQGRQGPKSLKFKKNLNKKNLDKKQVRKDVKDQDTSIYEYRNGSLWWSRETNSTILDATRPAVGMALGGGAKQTHQVRPLCFMTLLVEKKNFFFPSSVSLSFLSSDVDCAITCAFHARNESLFYILPCFFVFLSSVASAITCAFHARDTLCCLLV